MVKSLGYDRSPYEIIVGLNSSGTIAGAKLTYHNEPLFEHDVSEDDLLKHVERTKDINIANHMAGCGNSKTIVSINSDPDAAIFKSSSFGIVGNSQEIMPALVEEIRKLKA